MNLVVQKSYTIFTGVVFSFGHRLHRPLYENELSTSLLFVVLYLMCCILTFLLYLCVMQNVCRLKCVEYLNVLCFAYCLYCIIVATLV